MGAWGVGIFEDDDALDWVGTLAESATIAPVVDALRAVEAEGYPETSTCSAALAAAEVVAALIGRTHASLPEEALSWVRGQPSQINGHLLQLAREALHRIQTKSELRDLWEESEDFAAWQATMKSLEDRLGDA